KGGDENTIPDNGRLRSRHGNGSQVESPLELEVRHICGSEPCACGILESRVGDVLAPAIPLWRIRAGSKGWVRLAGLLECDRRRLCAACRGDVTQQREDLWR